MEELNKIQILDCTLRDGAHINRGNFGLSKINSIIGGLVRANIDIVEIGFVQNVDFAPGSTFFPSCSSANSLLTSDFGTTTRFGLMVRPDRCTIERLEGRADRISVVRVAFYAEILGAALDLARRLLSLGYQVSLNPINTLIYSEGEILKLVDAANQLSVSSLCIVDTFGSLNEKALEKLLFVIDGSLEREISIGLHFHENQLLGNSLAAFAIQNIPDSRQIIIDSSLMGMGRKPGNLATEQLVERLNSSGKCRYSLEPLLSVISTAVLPEREINPWRYEPEYMISGAMSIHRSYAEYLIEELEERDLALAVRIFRTLKEAGLSNKFNRSFIEELLAAKP